MSKPKVNGRFRLALILLLPLLFLSSLWSLLNGNLSTAPEVVAAPAAELDLYLELFADGLSLPTAIANTGVPGDGRLFVTQQGGQIRILTVDGTLLETPFLDVSGDVSLFGENGLLGLAFDPDYANNGLFYIYYTRQSDKNNVLVRYQVSEDANIADGSSGVILLTVVEPKDGHNGGALAFGADGYLYVAVGDGGLPEGNTPTTVPQDKTSLLGKILRLDVTEGSAHAPDCGTAHYTIPDDNPFRNGAGGDCDEIWALGLRNPWRISFDRATGDLFIADVGEFEQEEINFQPADSSGGENYGWPCHEGNLLHDAPSCQSVTYTFPVFTYNQDEVNGEGEPINHCSVTGGFVYRGQQYPAMQGHYLLADFCSGFLWNLHPEAGGWEAHDYGTLAAFPTTFGENIDGELYLAELSTGSVYHIVENSVVAPTTLAIHKSGPTESGAGAPIIYQISVTNTGSSPAVGLFITDTLPVGASYVAGSGGNLQNGVVRWDVGELAAGSSTTVAFAVTAVQAVTNFDYGAQAAGGVSVQGETAVTTQILAPSLRINKVGTVHVQTGEPIHYTLTVRNDGTLPANNLVITDRLPTGTMLLSVTDSGLEFEGVVTWNLLPLAAGGEVSVGLVVTPTTPIMETAVLRNEFYGATAEGGYGATGPPVVTIVNGTQTFTPLILRP
ncbi:PQQ-dependent sugar dehydrogenase [Candidatus Leptofilum sp.]|uniref:PQQ-dependent sugar dehydrogenase n=1 Tax=Candidatus Leptofilum sp. TaxID=3241576 RepID=UPI003B590BD6